MNHLVPEDLSAWLLPYPGFIAFEVSGACQAKCVHCPHGQGLIKNPGIMKLALYEELIKEIRQLMVVHPTFKPDIVLYGNGEPLLNKHLTRMICLSAETGCKTVLSSNVVLIKPEHGKAFSDAGLSLIKLSFWGDNAKEYHERTRLKFQTALERAKAFVEQCNGKTEIVINIVKSRANPELTIDPAFKAFFEPERFPQLSFYAYYASDWRGTIKNKVTHTPLVGPPDQVPCRLSGELMPITWDGKIAFCWLDYNREIILAESAVGNLLSAWRSPQRQHLLQLMVEKRPDKISICRECSALYSEGRRKRILEKAGQSRVIYDHLYRRDGKYRSRHADAGNPNSKSTVL